MARILIADDEIEIRDILRIALTSQGHACDEAPNGAEALKLLKKSAYDLVILDKSMPKMTGLQAVAAIRKDPALQGQLVWICTAADMTKEVEAAFKAGANDYLAKPIDLNLLAQKLRRHLGPKTA